MGKVVKMRNPSASTTNKNKNANILFYGDFNCTTGFGNVSKQLIDNWSKNKNFNIVVLAINDLSEKPYNYKPNVFVIPCLVADENKDSYARLELLKTLYAENYDVFFALNDIEVLNSMTEHLSNVKKERAKANKKKTKYILYTPIDSEPRPSDCNVLTLFDEVITYTEYGKATLKPLVSESIWKKIKVIPHGIDTEVFYPIDNKFEVSKTKEQLFGKSDVFVFGSVNRNSARKDLATLMIGFAMFKHTSQANAVLYLHCNPKDKMGIDCFRLSERLGLDVGTDIFFPKDFNENNGVSESELNKIYNTFDCFITTTTAEGWGLSVVEAMATKKLVVAPRHTSIQEITDNGNNAFLFKFMQRAVFVNDFEKIRFISNPEEVAQVCGIVYNMQNEEVEVQEQVKEIVDRAYNHVTKWNWEDIAKKFEQIILKLI
jgi:glycosyltransferase involved in cell wall biosynthesis